jgi:hypothetical protein
VRINYYLFLYKTILFFLYINKKWLDLLLQVVSVVSRKHVLHLLSVVSLLDVVLLSVEHATEAVLHLLLVVLVVVVLQLALESASSALPPRRPSKQLLTTS